MATQNPTQNPPTDAPFDHDDDFYYLYPPGEENEPPLFAAPPPTPALQGPGHRWAFSSVNERLKGKTLSYTALLHSASSQGSNIPKFTTPTSVERLKVTGVDELVLR